MVTPSAQFGYLRRQLKNLLIMRWNPRVFTIIMAVIGIIILVRILRRPSDSYSPEQLNTMFQDKLESVVHVKKAQLHDQDLAAPYVDPTTLRSDKWNFAGKYMVQDGAVRLVQDKQHQAGSAFAKRSVQAESFEMEVTFNIHTKNANSRLFADGMAIWFLDSVPPIGDVFGAPNYFNGLGIFIDTYKNGKGGTFPQIAAVQGDGKTRYNKDEDGVLERLAGCKATKAVNNPAGPVRMRIVHLKNGYLSVDINYNPHRDDRWKNCFTVENVVLPTVKYLGFSAETGELSHAVDILENKIYALYHPEDDRFIASVDELEGIIRSQLPEKDFKKGTKASRKSILRLRASERRIKERDRARRLELYGDPDATFIKRTVRKIVFFFKMVLYVLLAAVVSWIAYNVYRSSRRTKKTKGLLD